MPGTQKPSVSTKLRNKVNVELLDDVTALWPFSAHAVGLRI